MNAHTAQLAQTSTRSQRGVAAVEFALVLFLLMVLVSGTVSLVALCVAWAALWGVEQDGSRAVAPSESAKPSFRMALAQAWTDPHARRFTIFVFVSIFVFVFIFVLCVFVFF